MVIDSLQETKAEVLAVIIKIKTKKADRKSEHFWKIDAKCKIMLHCININ